MLPCFWEVDYIVVLSIDKKDSIQDQFLRTHEEYRLRLGIRVIKMSTVPSLEELPV